MFSESCFTAVLLKLLRANVDKNSGMQTVCSAPLSGREARPPIVNLPVLGPLLPQPGEAFGAQVDREDSCLAQKARLAVPSE